MDKEVSTISNRQIAQNGALISIAVILFYSLLVMIYVMVRSSVSLTGILPAGERNGILLGSNASIMYSVTVISLLVAFFSSIGGALGALLLKKLLVYFNPGTEITKAGWIGFIFSIFILSVVYFMLRLLFGEKISPGYMPTFLFWFLIPAAICLVVCLVGARKLNNILARQ